jgi:biopolymer transport protein ExbD
MRRSAVRKADDSEINMTSLLDIVFILLIFFIISATFTREVGIDLQQRRADAICDCNVVIMVQVANNDTIFVNQERTDPSRVYAAVLRFLAEAPDSPVLLEVADGASHGLVVEIWDKLQYSSIAASLQRAPDAQS